MTLNEITSAIRNHMHDGLKGEIINTSYSLDQLEEEVILARASLYIKHTADPKINMDNKHFLQTIDNIPVKLIDMNNESIYTSNINQKGIYVPKLLVDMKDESIDFLGDARKSKGIKVYYDTSFSDHSYRPYTAHAPYAWYDTTNKTLGRGQIIYLFNLDRYNEPKKLSLRAVLADPRDTPYGLGEFTEFPCPGFIQEMIINMLTERYVNNYRKLNIPVIPNSQTEIS